MKIEAYRCNKILNKKVFLFMEEALGMENNSINLQYLESSVKLNKGKCSKLVIILYHSKSLRSLKPLGLSIIKVALKI